MAERGAGATMEGNALVVTNVDGVVAIFSHGPTAMSVFEADTGRIVAVSDAWVTQYGFSREEAMAMTVAGVSAEPDETRAAMARASAAGGAHIARRWHKRKDGTVFPVEMTTGTLRLGERLLMYAAIYDITERERAAEALRRSEAGFRALIEAMPDGVVVHRNGRVVYANPAACVLHGYSGDAMVGRLVAELVHSEDRASMAAMIAVALDRGSSERMESRRAVRADGSTVTVEVAAIALQYAGEPAVLAILRDTSERRRMEAQLMVSDRLASLGRLAASVGHEINNPIAYVLGNVQLMRREIERAGGAIPAGVARSLAERLEVLEEGANRVRDIVRDLRTLSTSTREREASSPVDLSHLLDVCGNMAEHELRHRARLVKDYGPALFVLAQEARLGQVFLNLLVNAAQAIPEGSAERNEVRVVTRAEGDRAVVEVWDSGVGIPLEVRSRIFEPFVTTKAPGAGTGLGLSICQMIVTALGGTIEALPAAPRGTCFRVVLPAYVGATVAPVGANPATATPPAGIAREQRPRVLVVDDEAPLAAVLAEMLEGYDVTVRYSGRAALDVLASPADFDAVLLDVRMADVGGVDVYESLRASRPELARRVVFMTGGAVPARARPFLDGGGVLLLEKPFDTRELLAAVRTARDRRAAG